MSTPAPTIAILSDLGTQEHHVGSMKGVIAGICPSARILDLTHAVASGDVSEGAQLLVQSSMDFPQGTLFLAVVNPAAAPGGRGVAARTSCGCWFVGPDNGLLTGALAQRGLSAAYALDNPELRYKSKSPLQFQGRDVYAPAVAHLAAGRDAAAFGPKVTKLVELPPPDARRDGDSLHGVIQRVDYFGNLVTSIPRQLLADLGARAGAGNLRVQLANGTQLLLPLRTSYAEADDTGGLTLVDAAGFLQLSLNRSAFSEQHGGKRGEKVSVTWKPQASS